MIINKHNMPKTVMRLLKQQEKNTAITIFENLYIDKIREDDRIECLNGQIELSFTPIYRHLKNNIYLTLAAPQDSDVTTKTARTAVVTMKQLTKNEVQS